MSNRTKLLCNLSMINLAVEDVMSGDPEREEFGLDQLKELSSDLDLQGTNAGERAQAMFLEIMYNRPLKQGILFNGQPLTPSLLSLIKDDPRPKETGEAGISAGRYHISPRRYEKKQYLGCSGVRF
jgi:hypothetical protein